MTTSSGGRQAAPLPDRDQAGRQLAALVRQAHLTDVIVLGLGTGGLAVAVPVARTLTPALDVLVVQELDLGDPLHPPMYERCREPETPSVQISGRPTVCWRASPVDAGLQSRHHPRP